MRRWRGWLVAGGVLVLLALGALWSRLAGPMVEVARVERGELVQRVVASGRVMPPARAGLGAVQLGRVVEVRAEEGQRVSEGQLLVRLDDEEAQAQLAQASASVAQAVARLEGLRAVGARVATEQLRQAEVRVAQAREQAARLQTLFDAGAVSRQAWDDARSALQLAESQLASAAAQARGSGEAGSELRGALAALEVARAARAAASARLEWTRIEAPGDGVVLAREVEPGDVVQPGRTLLEVARDGPTYLSVQLEEKNLSLVALGQPARASADAFPDRVFDARVHFIAPSVDPLRGTIEVRLRSEEPPAFLLPDMTVSVDIETAREQGALLLPAGAVRDVGTAHPHVLVVEEGRIARREVELGARGDDLVELASGVSEGASVVLDSSAPEPGQRVRPRLRAAGPAGGG